jgi:hypothetical protein
MNFSEGMRRLGILLGALGGLVGGVVGYIGAQPLWAARANHKRFASLMALPAMRKVTMEVKHSGTISAGVPSFEDFMKEYSDTGRIFTGRLKDLEGVEVFESTYADGSRDIFKASPLLKGNPDGIEKVHIDATGVISSIGLSTGETIYQTDLPSFFRAYLAPALFPLAGFLLPWGALKAVAWVGAGFFQRNLT